MTTAERHINLLSVEEIHLMNEAISKLDCEKILGVPAWSLRHTIDFIKYATKITIDNTAVAFIS